MGCYNSKSAVPPPATSKSGHGAAGDLSTVNPHKGVADTNADKHLTFAQTYELKEKLGKGQYAVVHRAVNRRTGLECAVKCIRKATLTAEDLAALETEVEAMRSLGDHPNFVRMYQYFEERDFFFIVLELISGGELFERIVEKERYSEREAREIVRQLTKAIAFAHSKGVVHRDLKPENILLKTKSDDTSIKVADLGFAKLITSPNQTMTTPCGTPGYVAPEILSGKPYTSGADVWSLGVIFYILLCGYPPFASERDDTKELFALIRAGRYSFDPREWGVISDGAKDLIRHILVTDPHKRYDCDQILKHPWMVTDATAIPDAPLAETVAQLKKFNARRRLKATLKAVRTTIRMKILLAARMQRLMDATKAAASASASPDGAPAAEEEDLPVDQAILRALKAAEAQGLTIQSPSSKRQQREEESEKALMSHLMATSNGHLAGMGSPSSTSAGGGGGATNKVHPNVTVRPGSAAMVGPTSNPAAGLLAAGGSRERSAMSPALGVVHKAR